MTGNGAPSTEAEPWDIGTGVTGFAWHAAHPRANLLLQHGYGDHAGAYVERAHQLIPRLLELGVTVYGFDMRGNGRSPGKRGVTDVERAVADHRAARARLRSDPRPLFLLGHSLGGLVTATSAVRDQGHLAGVVLVAPAIKYDVNALVRAVARAGAFLVPSLQGPMPAGTLESLTRDRQITEQIASDPLMYLGRVRWLTLGTAATIAHANWALYPRLHVPLLALHGTADRNTDPAGSRLLIDVASSSDKTLHLVEGGTHSLLDDIDGEATVDVILEWIRARVDTPDQA